MSNIIVDAVAAMGGSCTVASFSEHAAMQRHTARRALDLEVDHGHLAKRMEGGAHVYFLVPDPTVTRSVVWLRGTIDAVAAGLTTLEHRIRKQYDTVTDTDADTLDRLADVLAEAARSARSLG